MDPAQPPISSRSTISEWQKRLADTFTVNGVVGGYLTPILDRENEIADDIGRSLRGHLTLIDSFQSFFVETLQLSLQSVVDRGWPPNATNYSLTLVFFSNLFRRYRACELLFVKGYPLDGYALMRDLKDRAIMLAGLAHNMTTASRILGVVNPQPTDREQFHKQTTDARRREERRIAARILGPDSGIPIDIQRALKVWNDLFHDEVHGARLSLVHELDALTHGIAPTFGPTINGDATAMYMNRSAEIAWMIVRLLPYLQPTENAFGAEWYYKYSVLDDSLRYMVEALSSLGKEIGAAFISLIEARFSYSQPFEYFEADGTS